MRSSVVCLPLLLLVLLGAAPQPAQVSAHEKAARELFEIAGGEALARKGAQQVWEMFQQNPQMAEHEEVFRAWYRKFVAMDDLEAEMVKLYMRRFSEKELREITAFYKTPAGRKAVAALPDLLEQSSEIAMQRAAEHSQELYQMIAKVVEERESQPAADDKEAQQRTVRDIRNTGTAMFSWLTDQVGAAAAGQSQVDLDDYPVLSSGELQDVLVPQYMQRIPEKDGWGNSYEFFLNTEEPLAPQVMAIRSPGRNGRYSATEYSVTSFEPAEFDEDIVWADGFFVRWPQKN